jgi:dienelactone hydrolase
VKQPIIILSILFCAMHAPADLIDEKMIYEHDGTRCEGRFFADLSQSQPFPGVIIFHQWGGPGDYEAERARMLAATDWNAGDDTARGSAYNPAADKKSWEDLLAFFERVLR